MRTPSLRKQISDRITSGGVKNDFVLAHTFVNIKQNYILN